MKSLEGAGSTILYYQSGYAIEHDKGGHNGRFEGESTKTLLREKRDEGPSSSWPITLGWRPLPSKNGKKRRRSRIKESFGKGNHKKGNLHRRETTIPLT